MNYSAAILEISVICAGLAVLLVDLWLPEHRRRWLGQAAAGFLVLLLLLSFTRWVLAATPQVAFAGVFVQDAFALFFKRFFLVAAALVLLMSSHYQARFAAGHSEYSALVLFALAGMMFAASANDLVLLFVALELITVTFYVLTSFERARLVSLEAGVKYLIQGAIASAFMVFGITLLFGSTNTTSFDVLAQLGDDLLESRLCLAGLALVLVGLGFKIAAVPFQLWAPDVYQGAPAPTTAFLAVGSKAAGFALLLRLLFVAVPEVTRQWTPVLATAAALTILYGNLCAIPQRDLKRLLGYSSIANAGYLLLGVTAMSAGLQDAPTGATAILYYLAGYLFTVLGAFAVIALLARHHETADVAALAGLHRRAPLLAATLCLAMVSLAGIPPLAGFFGKFLVLRALIAQGHSTAWLVGVAIVGIVISFYYYFAVVRAIYWMREAPAAPLIEVSRSQKLLLGVCCAGMIVLGLFPTPFLNWAEAASAAFNLH